MFKRSEVIVLTDCSTNEEILLTNTMTTDPENMTPINTDSVSAVGAYCIESLGLGRGLGLESGTGFEVR